VESLLNRYRNITVLLLVIMAQLVLLAVSAKNPEDVRFIRIWTVTAITPAARVLEGLRGGGNGFLHNYVLLHDTNAENRRLRDEVDKLKMENVFLKNELNTADRAKALQVFQQHTRSKTLAATIIANGAGTNSKVVFVDRGTASGVQRGMAVVTPDGIVGKVIAAYPTASQILLMTDPDFAAGVVTDKGVHGTLKGNGTPQCKVDYVAFEEKVEVGEWVYTSGDDRIFPRGFRVGIVRTVRPGQPFKEILVEPSGNQRGLEDVLIVLEGVHERIPDAPSGMQSVYMAAPPPADETKPEVVAPTTTPGTEADRLRSQYKALGDEQKHQWGENPPGSKPVDLTKLGQSPAPGKNPATSPAGSAGAPASTGAPAAAPKASPAAPSTVAPPKSSPAATPLTNPPAKAAPGAAPSKNPPAVLPATQAPAAAAPPRNPADAGRRMNQSNGAALPEGDQPVSRPAAPAKQPGATPAKQITPLPGGAQH